VPKTVRFDITREDLNLLLAELRDYHGTAWFDALVNALLEAVAALDTHASRLDTSHPQETELPLAEEHAPAFRQWLEDAATRAHGAGDHAKADAFARVRASER
jgi:hypothetical protein